MARTMKAGFADRLRRYLRGVRTKTAIATLRDRKLSTIDLTGCAFVITHIYNCLAVPGALDAEKQYHVGTTKVLHWLFPDLFLIIDSNVARAFRNHFGVKFCKWAPQGTPTQDMSYVSGKLKTKYVRLGRNASIRWNPPRPRRGSSIRLLSYSGAKAEAFTHLG